MTPLRAANAVREYVNVAIELSQLTPKHLKSKDGRLVFLRGIWLLDNYWFVINGALKLAVNEYRWPTTRNKMMKLFPGLDPDSMYIALGITTIESVKQAVLGPVQCPYLTIPRATTQPQAGDAAAEQAWQAQERQRTSDWWIKTAEWVSTIAPAALKGLRRLGKVDGASFIAWDRGILAEVDEIENRRAALLAHDDPYAGSQLPTGSRSDSAKTDLSPNTTVTSTGPQVTGDSPPEDQEDATSSPDEALRVDGPKDNLPYVDESTFTVMWQGKTCKFKGRSKLLFDLFKRLNQRPGHRVNFDTLRATDGVWPDANPEDVTIRGALSRLRDALRMSDMADLADMIHSGHYGNAYYAMLDLTRAKHPKPPAH